MVVDGTDAQSTMETQIRIEFEECNENDLELDLNINCADDWKLDQSTQCRVTLEKLTILASRADFHKRRDLEERNTDSGNQGNIEAAENSMHLRFKLLVHEMCELSSKCEEKCGVCEEYVQKLQEHVIQTHGSHPSHGHGHSLPQFRCDICKKNCSTAIEFKRHRETHISESGASTSSSMEMTDPPNTTIAVSQ